MKPWLQQYLAVAAKRELSARESHYPAQVEAGTLGREEADQDIAAWRAIAELFAAGSAETGLAFAELELATSRALQRREEALNRKPADPDLTLRRDAVWAIHERISHQASLATMRPVRSDAEGPHSIERNAA